MTDARKALKEAIYGILHGHITIGGSTVLVGNYIPQDSPLPYVEMGNAVSNDISCHLGEGGWEITVDLDVWSRYNGDAEADAIVEQATALLGAWTPSIAGFSFTHFELEVGDAAPDPTYPARHCLVRVRAEMYEV